MVAEGFVQEGPPGPKRRFGRGHLPLDDQLAMRVGSTVERWWR
jgi:hypothetical protein